MMNEMYYDAFAERYVLKKDPYAPPERYVTTVRGTSDIYMDHWIGKVDGEPFCLAVAYSPDEYYTEEHDRKFKYMCEKDNFVAERLSYFSLPPEKFDEYAKKFGLLDTGVDDFIEEQIKESKDDIPTIYDSPITLFTKDIHHQIAEEHENIVMKAVWEMGVDIDKDKLIAALEQDQKRYRDAYAAGYSACEKFYTEKLKRITEILEEHNDD